MARMRSDKEKLITQSMVKELLDYDPDTGHLEAAGSSLVHFRRPLPIVESTVRREARHSPHTAGACRRTDPKCLGCPDVLRTLPNKTAEEVISLPVAVSASEVSEVTEVRCHSMTELQSTKPHRLPHDPPHGAKRP